MTSSRDAEPRCRLRTMTTRTSRPSLLSRLIDAVPLAVAAFALLCPSEANAQEWLRDRRYQEGVGIRAGDLELHPGIGGELGYDSNWFLRTHRSGYVNSDPNAAGVLRITPSFTIGTLERRASQ